MVRSLQISQLTSGRSVLLLRASSAIVGVLAITILAVPSATAALSLSLDLDTNVPILSPLNVTVDATLLDSRSHTLLDVSGKVSTPAGSIATPPVAIPSPSVPPIVSPSLSPPPAIASPTPSQPEPVATPERRSTLPEITLASATSNKQTAPTPIPEAAESTTQSLPFGLSTPGNFDFIPKTLSGDSGSFRTALIVLTGMAVAFLGFATFTTTRLARGSPKH